MSTSNNRGTNRLLVSDSSEGDAFSVTPANHHWLRITWTLSKKTHERAVAAMGPDWHRAEPVLRLIRVTRDDSGPHARQLVDTIPLPPDCPEWFVNVPAGSDSWLVELGYLSKSNRFFSLLHSSPITMPSGPSVVTNASQNEEQGFAPFANNGDESVDLHVETELVIIGCAEPTARVTIDEAVQRLDPRTGQFHWKTSLTNGRYVIPIEASTDREKQRVLLAVETNSHTLDPEPLARR